MYIDSEEDKINKMKVTENKFKLVMLVILSCLGYYIYMIWDKL